MVIDSVQLQAPFFFIASFVCDAQSTAKYSTVTMSQPDSCSYKMNIRTKFACATQTFSDSSSDGLSGGSVFLIILLVVLVVYCIGGYAYNAAYKNEENKHWSDYKTHTPHLNSFWCLVPKWTYAGCCVTKEWISVNVIDKISSSSSSSSSSSKETIEDQYGTK